MAEFWKLLKESVIIQGIMALALLAVICYLYITEQDVPETLVQFFVLILGFYFGSKAQQAALRR